MPNKRTAVAAATSAAPEEYEPPANEPPGLHLRLGQVVERLDLLIAALAPKPEDVLAGSLYDLAAAANRAVSDAGDPTTLRSAVADVDARVALVESAVSGGTDTLFGKVSQVRDEIVPPAGASGIHARIEGVQATVDEVKGTLGGVGGAVTGIQQSVGDVDARVRGVDDKVTAVDGKVGGVDQKVAAVDGKLQGVDQEVASVRAKVEGVDGRVGGVADLVASVHTTVSAIQAAVGSIRDGVTSLGQALLGGEPIRDTLALIRDAVLSRPVGGPHVTALARLERMREFFGIDRARIADPPKSVLK